MLYDRHLAAPGPEAFADARLYTPNCSSRMDNLRAAILRPQLRDLDAQVDRWNARYAVTEDHLRTVPGIRVRDIPNAETHVGSSIQFRLPDLSDAEVPAFIKANADMGVELMWFGLAEPHGYTSAHQSWRFAGRQEAPTTDRVLSRLFDMRIPLTFSEDNCRHITRIIAACATRFARG